MNRQEAYEVLGINSTATEKEIKKAKQRKAMKAHPDKGGSDEEMAKVNEAYEVLTKKDEKEEFKFSHGHSRSGSDNFYYNNMSHAEMMKEVHRGQDHKVAVTIPLERIVFGGKEKINVGSRTFDVIIPKGITESTPIIIKGEGGPASHKDSEDGNLRIHIHAANHPVFVRDRYNLYIKIHIDFYVSIMGGEVVIPAMDGDIKIKIPTGIVSGSKIRIAGKGIKVPMSSRSGDIICVVIIDSIDKSFLTKEHIIQFKNINDHIHSSNGYKLIDKEKRIWSKFKKGLSKFKRG